MMGFKLGNEMWKVRGTRKKSESSAWPPEQRAGALSNELRELVHGEKETIFCG